MAEGAVESIYLLFYFIFYDDLGEEELYYIFISARLTFIGEEIEKLS